MVRPPESDRPTVGRPPSRCTDPGGASSAPVGTGAPGSRPQARDERPVSRAGRQEPLRRERARGPQHEVNPAASTDSPRGSRAAHVTAKATPTAPGSGSAGGPPGVRGAAREQGSGRKRRDRSARPWSRQGGPYKPTVKSGAAQRESEGIVVPVMAATNNAAGGKGPWGDRVGGGGKREGMAGKPGPTPAGLSLRTKCDNSDAGYTWRPSGRRVAVSTRSSTASTGVTSCGRRGGASGPGVEQQALWRRSGSLEPRVRTTCSTPTFGTISEASTTRS
jgi:hypothetical protein